MQAPKVDGLAVLPELTEDATMVSNLLAAPVQGRDKIVRIMLALEDHFVAVSDIERINTASHRYINSRALMPSGSRVKVTVVGTRDSQGWISEIALTAEDQDAVPALAQVVARAAE